MRRFDKHLLPPWTTLELKISSAHLDVIAEFVQSVGSSDHETTELVFDNCQRIFPRVPGYVNAKLPKPRFSKDGVDFFDDARMSEVLKSIIHRHVRLFGEGQGEKFHCSALVLATIHPGKQVSPHVDDYEAHQVCFKVHVPITSNEGSFNLAYDASAEITQVVHNQVGGSHLINNLIPHSAINTGNSPRTHLIMDFMPNSRVVPGTDLYRVQMPGKINQQFRDIYWKRWGSFDVKLP